MDPRLATKTTLERQDDEAARHVRPAPKQKPPRQDLRRNQDHPDSDPDLDDASDRKDRSKNYKNVGGATAENVVRRFLARRRPGDRTPARSRETGKVVMVSPSTLKEQPDKYEPLKGGGPPKSEDPTKKEEAENPAAFRYPSNPADFKPQEKKPQPEPEPEKPQSEKPKADFYYQNYVPPSERQKAPEPEPEDTDEDDEWEDDEEEPEDENEAEEAPEEEAAPEEKAPEGEEPSKDDEWEEEPKAPEPEAPKPAEEPVKDEAKSEPLSEEKPAEKPAEEAPAEPSEPAPAEEAPEAEKPAEAEPEPAEEAPKPKKPKAPKEEPAAEEKPTEEAKPEPTEAEKAGIAAPKRREASHMEKREAASLLVNTFPPDVAANIMAAQMHPDDVRTLVRKFNAAKAGLTIKDPTEFASKMAGIYQTDPNKVPPPTKWKGTPFGKLNPEEQAEALVQHQLQVTALSLAAHEGLTKKLTSKGVLTGKPQVPPSLASNLASVMLSPNSEGQAQMLADKTFNDTLEGGKTLKMSDGAAKRLLQSLKGSAAASGVAKAFMQANDYQSAKEKFLSSGDISEWDSPENIFKGLKNASRFFEKRNALYGDESAPHPAGSLFRMRVVSRLKSLDDKSYRKIQAALPKLEESEYNRQMKAWGPKFKEWETLKEAHEAELEKYAQNPKGKPPGPFKEPEPVKPKKPVTVPDEEDDEDMWQAALEPSEDPKEPEKEVVEKPTAEEQAAVDKATDAAWEQAEAMTKKASDSRGFTYPSCLVMGSASKTGVYHGIDPYAYGPATYPGWLQAHQRDLNAADFGIIEASAQDWLKSPLLSVASEGMLPDARIRMALDLAIYNGPYNGAINPNHYDQLLTKLGGPSAITVRANADTSSFRPASVAGGKDTMKASNQLRKFAAQAAEKDPKLAYDMLDFADRLAEDEEKGKGMPPWLKDKIDDDKGDDKGQQKEASSDKFAALRSEVIKAAHASADRTPFLPLLQTIKTLG